MQKEGRLFIDPEQIEKQILFIGKSSNQKEENSIVELFLSVEICINFDIIKVIKTFRKPKGEDFYFINSYIL